MCPPPRFKEDSGSGCSTGRTATIKPTIEPSQAFDRLREGNERFAAGRPLPHDWLARVEATSGGQAPFAVVLACMDSRVPVEVAFDVAIGDIFTIRVAGNILNEDVLGSLEFACEVAGASAILVLGHTDCGAVKGAIARTDLGHLTALVEKIGPAVARVEQKMDRADPAFADRVAEINVEHVMAEIRERSPVLRSLERDSRIGLYGGVYDVASGRVSFFEPPTRG